ncbi:MAG: amidohydrolase, partial [Anaerolineae bacterium]
MTVTESRLLLFNAKIHTMDPKAPVASAIALRGNRIRAVGPEAEAAVGRNALKLDLAGRTVLPGLTDSHIHFTATALAQDEMDLSAASTVGEAVAQVAEEAVGAPDGAWIRGHGWDHNRYGRLPTRQDLDSVTPRHPVVLEAKDGHKVWVNSLALRAAGIDEGAADPKGGRILREEAGEPSGVLLEAARTLMGKAVSPPPPRQRQAALRRAMEEAWQHGLTGIHHLSGMDPRHEGDMLADYDALRTDGSLGLRVLLMLPPTQLEEILHWRREEIDPWNRLIVGGIKIFADGTLGSQTADLFEPFANGEGDRGIEVTAQEDLVEIVREASMAGAACSVHAIGDRAVHRALEALSRTEPAHGPRHRIEHVQLLGPPDVSRFSELRVVASMQPVHATSDMELADRYWGQRSRRAYAWRSLLDAGAVLAFGSDAPVETWNPWAGIHAAVTRQRANGQPPGGWYPGERLSVEDAVRGYTVGAAWAAGQEDRTGSL